MSVVFDRYTCWSLRGLWSENPKLERPSRKREDCIKRSSRHFVGVCGMDSFDYVGHLCSGNVALASMKCRGFIDWPSDLASQEGLRSVGSVCLFPVYPRCAVLCCNIG